MIIDIYTHITTERYNEALLKYAPKSAIGGRMVGSIPTMCDMDARFRIMDRYADYSQVIVMAGFPVEAMAKDRDAVELARIANDEAAELVAKHPSRFVGAVAALPVSDTEAALKELDRAINKLKLKGVVIHTPLYFFGKEQPPAGGKPIDCPELMPIYEKMAEYDLPIWIHPNPLCDLRIPDYTSESEAKYFGWAIFGWPYQDTLAQVRLIFSGVLDKYPNLKFINHHGGAMVPFLEKRIEGIYNMAEKLFGLSFTQGLSRRPLDYFRMFYSDTAIGGSTPGLTCACTFYGAKHLLFGTDMPFDQDMGDEVIREGILAVEQMDIPSQDKQAIFEGNARKLLLLD